MQPITPNKFPSRQAYLESLSRKIVTSEGMRPEIYADPKGIPTVGPGYALVVRSEGDTFAPRDRKEISDDLSMAMHGEKGRFRMSDAAYGRLGRAAAALNRGDKAAAEAEAAALRRTPDRDSGKERARHA